MITFVKTKTKTKQLCVCVCVHTYLNAQKMLSKDTLQIQILNSQSSSELGNGIWKDGRYEGEILVLLYYFCFV